MRPRLFMQIEVNTTYEQFFEASRQFCLNTTTKRRWNYAFLWYVYPFLGVLFAFGAVFFLLVHRQVTGTVIYNALASIFFLWCRFSAPRRLKKVYELQKNRFAATMTLTPEGLDCELKDGSARGNHKWSGFENWLETKEMFLLFPNQLTFLILPKDKLNDAEQSEVRGWISAAVKPA